jgi:hypothetical protein
MKKFSSIYLLLLIGFAQIVFAQKASSTKNEISLVFGLAQPIVANGFNFEIDYWFQKFEIAYSHGFGLEFKDDNVSEESRSQGVSYNIPHSLGFGFGYRITKGLNLRIEPKLHIWEVYYNDSFKVENEIITQYTTYTLGLGIYYRWTPFDRKDNLLKGLTISPSFRWWPNIASSLDNNEFEYLNKNTGTNEVLIVNNIGYNDRPFIFNISVGYTFKL